MSVFLYFEMLESVIFIGIIKIRYKVYYKYLMISEEKPDSHKKRISIIADTLKEHPEYILYVLSQDEYEDVKKWPKYPMEEKIEILDNQYIFTRALMLGLVDYEIKGNIAEVYLASDIEDYIGVLDKKQKIKSINN